MCTIKHDELNYCVFITRTSITVYKIIEHGEPRLVKNKQSRIIPESDNCLVRNINFLQLIQFIFYKSLVYL